MEDFQICNLKSSIKVFNCPGLDTLAEKCIEKNWICKKFSSYIVIKPSTSARFIIFRPKYPSNQSHINITGVRTYVILDSVLDILCEFLCIPRTDIVWNVDNISGKCERVFSLVQKLSPKQTINLPSLVHAIENLDKEKSINLRFNPESYGAVIVKHVSTTLIIYQTGRIVIIGGKEAKDIAKTIDLVSQASRNVLLSS